MADRFLEMLKTTGGRDALMCFAEFSPCLAPGSVSVSKMGDMAADYRSITRMEGLFKDIGGKMLPQGAPASKVLREFMRQPHIAALAQLNWCFSVGFFAAEGTKVLTNKGVINHAMASSRKAQLGGRQDVIWFWQLIFLQLMDVLKISALQGHCGREEVAAMKAARKDLLEHFLWFLFAWTIQPSPGTKAQLLTNPASSVFKPLHSLLEAATMRNLQVSPWTQKAFGMAATIPALIGAWAATRAIMAPAPAPAPAVPAAAVPRSAAAPAAASARQQVEAKMQAAAARKELSPACIAAFLKQYDMLARGETGMIPEAAIEPVQSLPTMAQLRGKGAQGEELRRILSKTVILKLNGGLGTGMGLDKAKSLLEVKDGKSFLDFIALQIKHTRKRVGVDLSVVLMNSFSTEADTKAALAKHGLGDWNGMNMVQNKVPKLLIDGLSPADNPKNAKEEWCPPGHGDLYATLWGSGKIEELLAAGKEYVFVSNSDNLGATLDTDLLTHFARQTNNAFMMEVATRTDADKKGGHLAKPKGKGGLLLRESAQCPPEDEGEFQNVSKHRFFNTNNLWFKLSHVKRIMQANGGVMELPMIRNEKTVDPKDASTPKCYQLETAMGAAIEAFGEAASAVVIERDRFAPVKKCDDLLNLRSDAYIVTDDLRLVLAPKRAGVPPTVSLGDTYKKLPAFDKLTQNNKAVPSMIGCTKLTFDKKSKPVVLEPGVVFKGQVKVLATQEGQTIRRGTYADIDITLPPSAATTTA